MSLAGVSSTTAGSGGGGGNSSSNQIGGLTFMSADLSYGGGIVHCNIPRIGVETGTTECRSCDSGHRYQECSCSGRYEGPSIRVGPTSEILGLNNTFSPKAIQISTRATRGQSAKFSWSSAWREAFTAVESPWSGPCLSKGKSHIRNWLDFSGRPPRIDVHRCRVPYRGLYRAMAI